MVQSSSFYRVLSGRTSSNLRRNTPLDSFLAKGSSPVKAFSFLYVSRFSTEPNNVFGHYSSKRRSRGPVMAAKKSSEGEKQEDGKYKRTVDLPKTVSQPHLDTFVVCRINKFVSLNLYEEGESPETVEMERGDLYFIRYKVVKGANESGKIDLI